MADRRYFFIVGSPRSGTTLLQSMISRAPGVHIPPETHFLNITWQWRDKMSDLGADAGWDQAVEAIVRRCERDEIEMDRSLFRERVSRCERTYASLLRVLLDTIADAAGAPIIGEKSPGHTAFVIELAAMMPEAKFIHIVRDPRDVALSQRQVWGRPLLQGALRWRLDLNKHREYARMLPSDRYTMVRYEDLVTDPQRRLRELSEFLGVEYDEAMTRPGERTSPGFARDETHKLQTLEPVTTGRIGRYRTMLKRREIAVIERTCAARMDELGYERETDPLLGALTIALASVPTLIRRTVSIPRRSARLRPSKRG